MASQFAPRDKPALKTPPRIDPTVAVAGRQRLRKRGPRELLMRTQRPTDGNRIGRSEKAQPLARNIVNGQQVRADQVVGGSRSRGRSPRSGPAEWPRDARVAQPETGGPAPRRAICPGAIGRTASRACASGCSYKSSIGSSVALARRGSSFSSETYHARCGRRGSVHRCRAPAEHLGQPGAAPLPDGNRRPPMAEPAVERVGHAMGQARRSSRRRVAAPARPAPLTLVAQASSAQSSTSAQSRGAPASGGNRPVEIGGQLRISFRPGSDGARSRRHARPHQRTRSLPPAPNPPPRREGNARTKPRDRLFAGHHQLFRRQGWVTRKGAIPEPVGIGRSPALRRPGVAPHGPVARPARTRPCVPQGRARRGGSGRPSSMLGLEGGHAIRADPSIRLRGRRAPNLPEP